MTLAPDKSELAQQIADALEEGINGSHQFYGSTYTKSDCCKIFIKPLLEKKQIDTLLQSLPPNAAESLKEKYSKLMSCFDDTGEPFDKNLPLLTVERYVKDLIQELRSIGQGVDQKTKTKEQKGEKPGPKRKHSDKKLQQAMFSFDEFYAECNDAKQAWNKVATHHGFLSWTAARQACYRFRQKRNK